MSAETVKDLDETFYPFKDMQGDSHISSVHEYINADRPDDDAVSAVEKEKKLDLLGLNPYSTAEDVRSVATSMRMKAQNSGINVEVTKALRWALRKSDDCVNDLEFNLFLLQGRSFRDIRVQRPKKN